MSYNGVNGVLYNGVNAAAKILCSLFKFSHEMSIYIKDMQFLGKPYEKMEKKVNRRFEVKWSVMRAPK